MQGQWRVFTEDDLAILERGSEEDQANADGLRELIAQYEANPLSFFLAHGGQKDFINDLSSDLTVLLGTNQGGKTFALLAWLALRIVRCDRNWPCFTDHGIKYIPWSGPKKAMLASYEMMIHCKRNLWPKLLRILPREELGLYSPQWARERGVQPKPVNWTTGPKIVLTCESEIEFYSYEQPAQAWESMTYDYLAADEQIPEDLYDAARTRGLTAQHWQSAIACTPHRIRGLAYTGGNTWIHRLYLGSGKKELKYKFYSLSMDDVPRVFISDDVKKARFKELVSDPLAQGNMRRYRHGRSRWYGEFEMSEGLVYDNWNPAIHWIDPFPIPTHWTRCRSVDPGRVHPFAVLWAAISPDGDVVLYREYYEAGLGMSENVRNVIAASGNRREMVGKDKDADGNDISRYEEVAVGEEYLFTVMDPRNFKHPAQESQETQGEVYARMGLNAIPGSGMRSEEAIPIVKSYLDCERGRKHLLVKLGLRDTVLGGDGEPLSGAPILYVFNTLRMFRTEIEAYINKEETEKPVDRNDHLMTALKYLILQGPRYMGPDVSTERHRPAKETPESSVDRYTGWARE